MPVALINHRPKRFRTLFTSVVLVLSIACSDGGGEVGDASSGGGSVEGPMATARFAHATILLPNGKVLAAGGVGSTYFSSAELYIIY